MYNEYKKNIWRVIKLLKHLHKRMIGTVRQADETIVIKRGKVVVRENHTSLLQSDGSYAKLYSMQSRL